MAIGSATIWEFNQAATSGNANGGGFNTANAAMLADLTTNANTANTASPIVSSVSYSFVATDVGNWLYIQSGTSWTLGFYQIASVAAGKATLQASIGAADQLLNGLYYANTVAGCATIGTPTGGVFSIDYSRSLAGISSTNVADYAAVGASVTLTSLTASFTPVMVGNIFFQSTAGTGAFGSIGRYEIATYVNATTVTLDRTPNIGTASVACAGIVGGALSLGSVDDAVFETMVAGNIGYVKFSTTAFTINGTVTVASAGTALLPVWIIGYNTQRGDNPTVTGTRPTFNNGTIAVTFGVHWNIAFMMFTGTGSPVVALASNGFGKFFYCKSVNKSPTAGRAAFSSGNTNTITAFIGCEGVSYRGIAFGMVGATNIFGCYAHDSNIGINGVAAAEGIISNSIIANNITAAINFSTAPIGVNAAIMGNTLSGSTSQRGTGMALAAGSSLMTSMNNIITGFSTGISNGSAVQENYGDYNDFYNNGTDVVNWNKGTHDFSVNPTFVNVIERTGSTATTTAGNHLVQVGAQFQTWGIVAGQDCIYISSGTSVAPGVYGILSVDSQTQITVDITLTANAVADKVWSIVAGNNYAVGQNLYAQAYPGIFPASLTRGYLDTGAAQAQNVSGTRTYGLML